MSTSLHICFVSDTMHSYFGSNIESGTGGAERQQYLLATEFRDRGYSVSVATLDYHSKIKQTIGGIDLWYVIPDVRGILRAPYKAAKTIRRLRQIDADVYYVRGNDFLCMTTAVYTQIAGNSFVYAVANDSNVDPDLLQHRGLLRYPYIWAMKSADEVVAQTNHQQDLLANEHGINAPVIPNGYDIPSESDIVPHLDRDHVLWVGSIDPDQKRPERFLKLAKQLPDITFRMIGPPDNDNPEYFNKIQHKAKRIPNLEFLGYIDPDRIHEYFKTSMVLVNTSDYEGFPNVFLEAWRYATPVISLYHTLDGTIKEEKIGIHAGSMEMLVEETAQLVQNLEYRKELGNKAREYMTENYPFERTFNKYEKIIKNVS